MPGVIVSSKPCACAVVCKTAMTSSGKTTAKGGMYTRPGCLRTRLSPLFKQSVTGGIFRVWFKYQLPKSS